MSNKPTSKQLTVQQHRRQFEAIGTVWELLLTTNQSVAELQALEQQIQDRIAMFDAHYSRFRADSLITKMSQQAGQYALPADARPLLDIYQQLYTLTDGAMTPLVGQLLSDAGYDAQYSLKPGQLAATPSWDEVLEYKFPKLTLKQPALLDFGAAGKGYLVDIIAELILAAGIDDFMVNAGGDITRRGKTVTAVGLENPDNLQQVIGVAQLQGRSLCASAGNRRVWANFHHIIDPRNQQSPRHIKAIWVVADSTLLADALTTALFFVEAATLHKCYAYEYALIRDDNSLEHSEHFPARFFTDD